MIERLKDKTLTFRIIATSLVISLTIVVALEIKAQRSFWMLMTEKDQEVTEKILESVTQQFDDNYRLMQLLLDQIVSNKDLLQAFAERNRVRLAALTLPQYQNMRKEGIYQYHFHLPDNTTLFRAHNPPLYDDDLTEHRPMLVEATSRRMPVSGLEEGVHGLSFRSIRPVFYNGNFLGCIELGMVLNAASLEQLKNLNGGEWHLCGLSEEGLSSRLGTNTPCPFPISPELIGRIVNDGSFSDTQGAQQIHVILLRDYKNNAHWALTRVFDNTDMLISRQKQSRSNMLLGFSLAGVGLLTMIFLLQRLLSPLTDLSRVTASISAGNWTKAIPVARKDEIGQLALSMKRMLDVVREKEAQLIHQNTHDQLTGIYNRTYFERYSSQQEGCSDAYPITIITADMDGLKLINDTMGHRAGDTLLQNCASCLASVITAPHVLARIGGDEFAAILLSTTEEEATQIITSLRAAVKRYNEANTQLPISISLGPATTPGIEHSLDDTFNLAESRMYKDKLYRSASARGQIVSALLAALSERDYVAEGHADRLLKLVQQVGEKMGLPATQISDLILLAKVHDLGKVGIPDQILFKPGELTESEWEIMHQHPEKGYRIAQASPDLATIAHLILHHHENWDGTGYPHKLQSTDIPVECRILAVVDSFDAMTNDRPYSKARSKEEALAELKRCAGKQFDPYIVDVFLSIV